LAITQAVHFRGGAQADNPEPAEIALAAAAIAKGIDPGANLRFFRRAEQLATPADKTLIFLKQTLLPLIAGYGTCNTHGV
jgi:hypothetical protein